MKRLHYLFLFIVALSLSFATLTSCREDEKKPIEKVEDAIDATGDAIEEGAEEIGDEIDDATDDN